MNRFFYLCVGLWFLPLQQLAAQGSFLISGKAIQPHICMQQSSTGLARPALYLLSGDIPANFPVAGTYSRSGQTVCYEPLYPLAGGKRFILRAPGCRDTIIRIADAAAPPVAPAAVAAFYPLRDSIPENILFFHIRFTQAMRADKDAWKKVTVTDDQGAVIPRSWRQRSFWLDSGRLLVLMIHPGRVKTGIRYTGPVFRIGRQYTITADSTLADVYGRKLERSVSHMYYVLPEHKEILKTCRVSTKLKAGSKDPVLVRFCNGVDHAAACTGIFMYDVAGRPIACTVQQYEECTVSVQPHDPWPRGKLKLELSGTLYDCAGNRLNRLFEMRHMKTHNKDQASRQFKITAE